MQEIKLVKLLVFQHVQAAGFFVDDGFIMLGDQLSPYLGENSLLGRRLEPEISIFFLLLYLLLDNFQVLRCIVLCNPDLRLLAVVLRCPGDDLIFEVLASKFPDKFAFLHSLSLFVPYWSKPSIGFSLPNEVVA